MLSLLDYQILLTLAYTQQFHYPLTITEIYQRLIAIPQLIIGLNSKPVRFGLKTVALAVKKLSKHGFLSQDKNSDDQQQFYCLPGSEADFMQRTERKVFSQQFQVEIDNLKNFLAKCPWVKAVAVTGAVAMNNAKSQDDLDLLVVTSKNRLWLLRILVLLLAIWHRKKSFSQLWQVQLNQQKFDHWDFNLWLDETNLSLSANRRNLYTAYEVCQARWIYDRGQFAQKFIELNHWVEAYLPNYYKDCLKKPQINQQKLHELNLERRLPLNKQTANLHLISPVWQVNQVKQTRRLFSIPVKVYSVICQSWGDKLNQWAFQLQKKHLQRKLKLNLINLNLGFAFLHLNQQPVHIIKQLTQILKKQYGQNFTRFSVKNNH